MADRTRPGQRRARAGPLLALVAGPLLLLAVAPPAEAQDGGTAVIVGQVVDAGTERPIPAASIRLEGADRVTGSDEEGGFTFEDVALGTYRLRVTHLSYETVEDTIRLAEDGAIYDARIRLSADAIELSGIVVEVWRTPGILSDVHARLERRDRMGLGEVFDRQRIDQSGAHRVSHLIDLLPGTRLQPIPGRVGATELRLHARNDCAPSYYLDGLATQIPGGSVDDLVPLRDVEAVEVYRRLSSIPGEFADERALNCGAVAVWTRRTTDEGKAMGWGRMLGLAGFASLAYLATTLWF